MWSRSDNQEVGLEAATLERVRNSSLVKRFRADNVAGLKSSAEAMAFREYPSIDLIGVQDSGWVGERRAGSEATE